jgi:alpha-galactosidase
MNGRTIRGLWCAALLAIAAACPPAAAVTPSAEEFGRARAWFESYLSARAVSFPWSFNYDGRSSADWVRRWKFQRTSCPLDTNRTEHTLRATDPETGLELRCVAVLYRDFPTIEWTLYFKNAGPADTPILSDIQALDTSFMRRAGSEFVLHHNVGSPCQPNDYQPLETPLGPNAGKRISAAGGRPTNSDWSYFNLEWAGQGVIVVVGWPGQWAAEFQRDGKDRLRVRAGQEMTRLKLHPGEEIRTPLIVLQFWKGDRIRAQNLCRRWMLAHNTPRPAGKQVSTHFASTSGSLTDAVREIALIDGWVREGIKLDYWIMDAGWYQHPGRWFYTGTWEVDRKRFPRGLREVNDRAHAHGMKTVVWFEPERVTPRSWLYQNHPEWLLGCANESGQTPQLGKIANCLLNLGNPDARRWATDHISKMLTDDGIDVYRQDFNIDPLAYWRANDAPDRRGITENAYVTGYLAFWDELLRRHPNLWIDTCASGGRRNDLETLRRSVPLLRSDFFTTAVGQQCHTYGLSSWLPIYGSGTGPANDYMVRSSFCPMFRIGMGVWKPGTDHSQLRRMVAQFRRIEPYLTGDFYPLTGYSLKETDWMAWQFDRPEAGGGVVQAFRRAANPEDTFRLRLCSLDSRAKYHVTDLDIETPQLMTGVELMKTGLEVRMTNRPAAAVIIYEKQRK